ncbi:nuclease, partial [Halobacteriales archaeon QS_3_64_16]
MEEETETETPEETTEEETTTEAEDSSGDLPPQSGGADDPFDCSDFDTQDQAQ